MESVVTAIRHQMDYLLIASLFLHFQRAAKAMSIADGIVMKVLHTIIYN